MRRRRHPSTEAQREVQVSIVLSFVIGALVGLMVVAFILLTGRLAARMYPPGSPLWRRVLVPTAGALVSGILLARFFPNARGSGIPQTKFAIFIKDGFIPLKTVLGKFVCCTISLASGVALGREGPSVHIGAGIASVLGRRFGLSKASVRALLPMGCSAALAAAFNTPIAAVLFSLEEVLGDLHAPVLGTVVISSATSWMVLHLILGDEALFHVPAYHLVHPLEFLIYAALGLIGGLVSVTFVKLLLWLRILFRGLPRWSLWLQPAIGGLFVGVLGLFLPEVLGVGYDYVERVLSGDLAIRTIALLAVLKIAATAVSYSSGNAGGIFGPSLFIGAMVGGVVGSAAHHLFPLLTATPGAYALVGMGAAFAGIIRTPFTSVLMIFELTRDYSIIVPLMIANLTSFMISLRLQREPIYEALQHQEGIFLPSGEEAREQGHSVVSATMRTGADAIAEETEAPRLMVEAGVSSWPFVRDGKLKESASHVYADQPLSAALEKMGTSGLDAIAVVSRADVFELIGVITLPDVLRAYGVESNRFG